MAITIETFDISGPALVTPQKFEDSRGFFIESYNQTHFQKAIKKDVTFVQNNHSLSLKKNTIRGLHAQAPPYAQAKLIRCTAGKILDVVIDIRSGSATYGKGISAVLSAENTKQLWVPVGFLHGFQTLSDNSEVQYQCTDYYNPQSEITIRWDDPFLNLNWEQKSDTTNVSEKDKNGIDFDNFDSPF